ncbi:MAG: hypothetical protein J6T10_22530 [Methanobrevibacter sp.]|nr:hypothetical protein [Methanobrevibacter sp.]
MYNFSKILYVKQFKNKVSKQAYLEACKWLAQNVYSKVELSKYITVQIIKENVNKKQLPTFTVKLFMTINEEDLKDSYCKKCKQLHTIFYSIDKPDCDVCKMNGYRKQLQTNVSSLVNNWKGKLEEGD